MVRDEAQGNEEKEHVEPRFEDKELVRIQPRRLIVFGAVAAAVGGEEGGLLARHSCRRRRRRRRGVGNWERGAKEDMTAETLARNLYTASPKPGAKPCASMPTMTTSHEVILKFENSDENRVAYRSKEVSYRRKNSTDFVNFYVVNCKETFRRDRRA